jgi:cytidylate kinase
MDHKVVAIDGPAGAGKGTIARFLAKKLNFIYIDSGLFYRYYAYKEESLTAEDLKRTENFFAPVFQYLQTGKSDVIPLLKTEECGNKASKAAIIAEVRDFVNKSIRAFSAKENIIIDGRDVATVIFPDATVKLFITASIDERARRRLLENEGVNERDTAVIAAKLPEYVDKIKKRDERDTSRVIAPLEQASDAIMLDTSNLAIDEACEAAWELVSPIFDSM